VCIVGGGNAAHALAAMLPSKGFETYWYCGFKDEAEKIKKGVKDNGYIKATFHDKNNDTTEMKGNPKM
ncbi:hypothetical protein SARC_16294, partial [Sphaeroforma arctica JP610]